MNRYINADKLIKDLGDLSEHYTDKGKEYHPHIDFVMDTVNQQPMADVRETVKEHWVVDRYCSVCDFDKYEFDCCCGGWPQNFCPNCGADMMRGEA